MPTLIKIFKYTEDFWMTWPLATVQFYQPIAQGSPTCRPVKVFDAGFPMGEADKALEFIDAFLQPEDPGAMSKCLAWLCLNLQKLPNDFEDAETGLPLSSEDMIKSYLTKIESFYQSNPGPACNIEFVEASVLLHQLYLSLGRPSKAWKTSRAAVSDAMLLGLHLPGSSVRERGVWETLWMQDRQLSMFLGFPYAVPEHLTTRTTEDEYPVPEQEIFRRMAMTSGRIGHRDQVQENTPVSILSCISKGMKELKDMIPDEWGTKSESGTALSFAQVFVHTNIKLYYHTINQAMHLPYARLAAHDGKYEYARSTVLESAEGAIRAYQDMRALEVKTHNPVRNEYLDFLAFQAAVILAVDLISPEFVWAKEEEQRLWTIIFELTQRMTKTNEVSDRRVVDQAATVLENLYAASHGVWGGRGQYQVTIPYFGRIKISSSSEATQHHTREHQMSEATKTVVELESNMFTFRRPDKNLTAGELTGDWSAGSDSAIQYEWKGVYEFADQL
ncbi:hypothetical protein F66182_8515 [Fusarium sp. NRRL 66182]|nr:hypothetical protein F66182_8515 [Fusarium sp. NRRL 66182]